MRMRWFLRSPIKSPLNLNLSPRRSFSLRALVPHWPSPASPRSLPRSSIPMAAIHNHSNSEAGLARRFWIKFTRQSIFAMYTPFAIAFASGNLNIDSFHHYVAQDVHFLPPLLKLFFATKTGRLGYLVILHMHSLRYELAEECVDDDDAKLGICQLRKAVLEESKMHHSLVKDESDVVFRVISGKWCAVVVEISRMHKIDRLVLVGTTSD